MQAQNFGGTLYGNPQERELPVQCPLSALSASDVNSTNRELKNFAFIIKQAFDNLSGLTFDRFIFQGGAIIPIMFRLFWKNWAAAVIRARQVALCQVMNKTSSNVCWKRFGASFLG
jgi:hypothetical protein